ncbi:MAG: hypothetical protein LV468_04580, partial [Candidatus Nitrosotenuis sp.]|nr:hypothetical protein [Candidatus Nitrosotenuis sp.]
FGTLGLTSLILGTITYLSWKDRLGKFGKIYIKSLHHKILKKLTKWRIIAGFFLTFWLAAFSAGMHASDNTYHAQTEQLIEKTVELKGEQFLTPEGMQKEAETQYTADPVKMVGMMLLGIVALPLVVFLDFPLWSMTTGMMNYAFGGQFVHIIDILLVEEIEIFGLMIFVRHVQKTVVMDNS